MNHLHMEPLNLCGRPSFQNIGGRFSLSQRERAGVRENCSDKNPVLVHGEQTERTLVWASHSNPLVESHSLTA
jgi:hypothetical protein